jgi:hypothetical protein
MCHTNNPVHTESPQDYPPPSKIELLPFELIYRIIHDLPLSSLLSFLSTSRNLRSSLIGLPTDRDALARSWIITNAPWYYPDEGSSPEGVVGWEYLQRCIDSGSMRNRRRIWRVAEQLERLAVEIGIQSSGLAR